jgi:hypothetical protein
MLQLAVDEFLAIPSCVLLPEDVPQSTQYNKEDEQLLDKEIEQLEVRAKRVCSVSHKFSSARHFLLMLWTKNVYLGEISIISFMKALQAVFVNRQFRGCSQKDIVENVIYLAL